MVQRGSFHAGSGIFAPLEHISGIPVDQINFMVCEFVALALGFVFRHWLSPRHVGSTWRHWIELTIGLGMAFFCFGYQVLVLFVQCTASLILLYTAPAGITSMVTFIGAMFFLSVVHIYRVIYDYGGYTLDVTGPLMIMTQKVTSLAFSYKDGTMKDRSHLSTDQKKHVINRLPSVLEYYSYMFYFHGILCGPLCFFTDYDAFIHGKNYVNTIKTPNCVSNSNQNCIEQTVECTSQQKLPSPLRPVITKLLTAIATGTTHVLLSPYFPNDWLKADEFLYHSSLIKRTVYIFISVNIVRLKYYCAWSLGASVNNAAGLGYNGITEEGHHKWDLVDNVDIIKIETATSLKVFIDNWNITTANWLRQVVYTRAEKLNMLAVFTCSAFWHGFYPGYYLTFGTGALLTMAARLVRRSIRPFFQKTKVLGFIYDVITLSIRMWAAVMIASPFVLLEIIPSLRVYQSFGFSLHIGAVVMIAIALLMPHHRTSSSRASTDHVTSVTPSSATDKKEN